MIQIPALRDTFMMLETFEKTLNVVAYVPVVGSIAAVVRSYYANIEIITGIGLTILSAALHLKGHYLKELYLSAGIIFIGHGLLNAVRSRIELQPFLPLLTTLPYDLLTAHYVGTRFFSYIS